ncbi:MAG: DUF1176 domain-containing protein [Pseudomonadota bacterium]|nr:DUF1176 domain-containing protein [Pseudomonadota bacterium]
MTLERIAALSCAIALAAAPARAQPVTVPAEIEKVHLADEDCEDYEAAHMVEARITGKLDDKRDVYMLPCFTGAYNVIYRIYVWDAKYPDNVSATLFAGYSDAIGWYGRKDVVNADYDAATRTLTAFEKGRGLGDCGSQPTWKWTEYGWRLVEYRYWDKCDGSRSLAEWPVVYRYAPAK